MKNNYEILKLYPHNIIAYNKVKIAFDNANNIALIVQAPSTGKTFIFLALALDNKDKSILYITPSNAIIENIKETITSLGIDLPNIKFRTYASIIEKEEGELKRIDADYIIIDEIHNLKAPIWGSNIEKLIETHPNSKILGLSAQEIDKINPTISEIFSNKLVNSYSLIEAMNDRVLPKPIYKTAYLNLIEEEKIIEEKLLKKNIDNEVYKDALNKLNDAKKQIQSSQNIKDIIKKNIKPNGKYIYFCPPLINAKTSNIEDIKSEAFEWFKEITNEENIIFYTSTNKMGINAKKHRDAFYSNKDLEGNDAKNKLKVMFAINQYNEGIHDNNIDGIILGRSSSSDIEFYEHIARCLNIRDHSKEEIEKYMTYSIRQLREECKKRGLFYSDFDTDEILINKLTSPIIIDLTNNSQYIKELENNLTNKIQEEKQIPNRSVLKLNNPKFDIKIENINIHEILEYVLERINLTWFDYFEYAKTYYEHYNNLEIPIKFRTNDGLTYNQNGFIELGQWINTQKINKKENKLSEDRINKLNKICINWDDKNSDLSWNDYYKYAQKYFEHHENLEIPSSFKTDNGYDYKENGRINLGHWLFYQRDSYKNNKLSDEQIAKLMDINMRFDDKQKTIPFNDMINYIKLYIEHNNTVDIPKTFRTNNGYEYDENGKIPLGGWISNRKNDFYQNKLSDEKLQILRSTGLIFDMANKRNLVWDEMYQFAKEYYNKNTNLIIPDDTTDEQLIKLKNWINNQKTRNIFYDRLDENKRQKLLELNIKPEEVINWDEAYDIAKQYYNENKNLNIPSDYKIKDDFNLKTWIAKQRATYNAGNLSKEKTDKLNKIGFNFNKQIVRWEDAYNLAKQYYLENGTIDININTMYKDYSLGTWVKIQKCLFQKNKLSEDKINKLKLINMPFDKKQVTSWETMFNYVKEYFNYYGNLNIPYSFITNDGITNEKEGQYELGKWVGKQRFKYNHGKLSEDKIRGLEKYGMTWNITKNNETKREILREYGINYEKDKLILEKIPIQTLEAKILYCLENKMKIKNEDNTLINLFFMTNQEFNKQYGVNISDLIDSISS